KGIWKELEAPQVKVDPYRRELQRSYLQAINNKLNPPPAAEAAAEAGARGPLRGPAPSGDEKPLYRVELRALNASITAALLRTTDHQTKAHLEAAKDEIAKILDPANTPRSGSAAGARGGRGAIARR